MRQGHTANIPIEKLLYLYQGEKATGCLRLKTDNDDIGFVYIEEGNPVHAMYRENDGEKAFADLLKLPPSKFHFLQRHRSNNFTLNGTLEELFNPTPNEKEVTLSPEIIGKWISLLTEELGPFASSIVEEALRKENLQENSVARESQLNTIIDIMCEDIPKTPCKALRKALAEATLQ